MKELTSADLRLDNIINYHTTEGDTLQNIVDWQCIKWVSEKKKQFNLVHSAIPLTEEWLLRFGFISHGYKKEFIGKNFRSDGMTLDFVLSKPFSKGEWNELYTYNLDAHRFINIKHVHQLQNLYHALTGEELTLKTQ